MKRFIRYLYEYEQGKRTRNVGFVKVEQDDYECTVHVHGKGLRMNGEKLGLYLFYEEDGMCVGIRQGEIDNINPAVNCRLHYTREDVGEAENFPRINGVIMSNGSGRKYASVWDDTIEADVDRMRLWTEKPEPENRREEEAEGMENLREEEAEELENLREEEAEELENLREEAEEPESRREEDLAESKEPEWKGEFQISEEADRREENQKCTSSRVGCKVTKVQRKELARLPRCEWRLANNQFLLHGYYNYHHLVFIENGQMMYLGVPGIYHEKEAQAASVCGFPDFVPMKELDVSLTADECDEQEEFGYWCRQVRHPFY